MSFEVESDPFVEPEILREANSRHDREHGHPFTYQKARTRGGWNLNLMHLRGRLSDKAIEKYEKLGLYTQEYRDKRRKNMATKVKRQGSFISAGDGRFIYSPQ